MLDHLKPIGGFIENTLRPLIEESKQFLDELESKGINVNERNIKRIISHVSKRHLVTVIIQSISSIIVTGVVSYTAWKICQL